MLELFHPVSSSVQMDGSNTNDVSSTKAVLLGALASGVNVRKFHKHSYLTAVFLSFIRFISIFSNVAHGSTSFYSLLIPASYMVCNQDVFFDAWDLPYCHVCPSLFISRSRCCGSCAIACCLKRISIYTP